MPLQRNHLLAEKSNTIVRLHLMVSVSASRDEVAPRCNRMTETEVVQRVLKIT